MDADKQKNNRVFISAITRAEYDSWPACVRFFSPPFEQLAHDHYETHAAPQPARYTTAELLEYFRTTQRGKNDLHKENERR